MKFHIFSACGHQNMTANRLSSFIRFQIIMLAHGEHGYVQKYVKHSNFRRWTVILGRNSHKKCKKILDCGMIRMIRSDSVFAGDFIYSMNMLSGCSMLLDSFILHLHPKNCKNCYLRMYDRIYAYSKQKATLAYSRLVYSHCE